jgi:hypothetical protein
VLTRLHTYMFVHVYRDINYIYICTCIYVQEHIRLWIVLMYEHFTDTYHYIPVVLDKYDTSYKYIYVYIYIWNGVHLCVNVIRTHKNILAKVWTMGCSGFLGKTSDTTHVTMIVLCLTLSSGCFYCTTWDKFGSGGWRTCCLCSWFSWSSNVYFLHCMKTHYVCIYIVICI